jgi:integrase
MESGSEDDITFDFLLASYLKFHTLRPSSVKNYRNCFERFGRETEITLLSEISEELLVFWKNEVLARATATTWNNYHTHLRALLNFAVRRHWMTENYLLNIPKARKPTLEKKTIELDALSRVFHALDEHEDSIQPKWFWDAVIKVLFFTGMRQNQLLSLKWKNINFEKNDLFLSLDGSKAHREWTIPLPEGCVDELLYLKEQTERQLGPVNISDHPVFRLQLFNDEFSGFGLTTSQIEGFFKKISRLSGEKISSHRLRHTMATLIAQNGDNPDLKSLQFILGHTDIRTTMEYIEPNKKHLHF